MEKIKEIYYSFTTFFRNLKLFWKVLRNYHWWDYQHVINANIVMFKDMAEHFEKDGTTYGREKIAENIKQLVELLEKDIDNEAWEEAEKNTNVDDKIAYYKVAKWEHKKKITRILIGPDLEEQIKIEQRINNAIESDGMTADDAILKYRDYSGIEKWWD
jgi:hypothetical protein